MITLLSSFTAFLLLAAFLTHILGLPANWFILAILALWAWLVPHADIPLTTFAFFTLAALVGELVEFALQSFGAHKYGATRSGNWGALGGAILGAIIGAPFFLGLGALVGAVGGAYLGCLGIELINKRPLPEAKQAALGAMLGKVLGMAVKIGIGIVLLIQSFKLLF
jgi:uncharacterized protein YqgC (DUF456 family)